MGLWWQFIIIRFLWIFAMNSMEFQFKDELNMKKRKKSMKQRKANKSWRNCEETSIFQHNLHLSACPVNWSYLEIRISFWEKFFLQKEAKKKIYIPKKSCARWKLPRTWWKASCTHAVGFPWVFFMGFFVASWLF